MLKGLTLRHPWAFAVGYLGKTVENRTWKPPRHILGRYIAIHGGSVPKGQALEDCVDDADTIARDILTLEYLRALPEANKAILRAQYPVKVRDWVTPGIVAVAKLECVVTDSDNPWFFGPYGFVLGDVTPINPLLPHRGARGFWDVEAHTETVIRDVYACLHHGEVMPDVG